MNRNAKRSTWNDAKATFNSLYLGFLHESDRVRSCALVHVLCFQFPLLGISPWISCLAAHAYESCSCLSIPSTWDFSMNQVWGIVQSSWLLTFNSLYLGFLHESDWCVHCNCNFPNTLSIPSTWDFSMNRLHGSKTMLPRLRVLSIPSTWDFSMNPFQSMVV